MTLLLREILRFLFETALWSITLAAIASVVTITGWKLAGRRMDMRIVGIAVVSAAGVAALAARFPGITLWDPRVGSRSLPVVWVAVGAAAATAIALTRTRQTGE